ncbi:cell division control protein Cdc6 [Halorientalis sp. IM1011]|uniref:Cdc6/Cdc18 family protein n=1 Tax=Halorientalis sp. IM1011 TaxID=1932360 RepID=UPI00097CD1F7|nr:ORC1-type DNA replication protein [Halorientalis sp. IM1011]AQL42777.1 cell division control protein Cdc6 [Halorientalis sp. IM1011]
MTGSGNESDGPDTGAGKRDGQSGPDGQSPLDDAAGDESRSSVDVETSISDSSLDDVVLDDVEEDGDLDEASRGLFDDLLSGAPIFENKEVLRPSYTPRELPHRQEQINNMATILVSALRGDTPSNILIYGKTGTGKTASAKFVSEELETTSQKYEVPCEVQYINCEVTDTQYRVLAQLANKFIEQNRSVIDDRIAELEDLRERAEDDPSALASADGSALETGVSVGSGPGIDEIETVDELDARIEDLDDDREEFEEVPMTGWPTDRVYNSFFEAVDYHERVVVIMLDEIDKLVEKSGDDTLYNLSRMNSELDNSRVSIMGISNDLKFTDFLDPRVKSSLGEEEIVFPPYDANQLRDILQHRANDAFEEGALSDDVIPLCAAFAAQEHGDARRALDLLRTAGELAERGQTERVEEDHVRRAQEKIELDRVVEVVRTLPTQSKLVLFAIILLEKNGVHNINTGEVYNIYKRLCEEIDADTLTQRRVTDLISELDMLGIVNAVVVSKGRYGRTKEISLSVPIDETEAVLLSDSRLGDIEDVQPFVQARFDN